MRPDEVEVPSGERVVVGGKVRKSCLCDVTSAERPWVHHKRAHFGEGPGRPV